MARKAQRRPAPLLATLASCGTSAPLRSARRAGGSGRSARTGVSASAAAARASATVARAPATVARARHSFALSWTLGARARRARSHLSSVDTPYRHILIVTSLGYAPINFSRIDEYLQRGYDYPQGTRQLGRVFTLGHSGSGIGSGFSGIQARAFRLGPRAIRSGNAPGSIGKDGHEGLGAGNEVFLAASEKRRTRRPGCRQRSLSERARWPPLSFWQKVAFVLGKKMWRKVFFSQLSGKRRAPTTGAFPRPGTQVFSSRREVGGSAFLAASATDRA